MPHNRSHASAIGMSRRRATRQRGTYTNGDRTSTKPGMRVSAVLPRCVGRTPRYRRPRTLPSHVESPGTVIDQYVDPRQFDKMRPVDR
jgi:hypothetical protein